VISDLGVGTQKSRNQLSAENSRTALRTVETSSYTFFGVLRQSRSLWKLFKVLVRWPLTR